MVLRTRLLFVLLIFLIVTSCKSRYANIPYFQNLQLTNQVKESVDNFTPITIQKDDVLGIYITSTSP
jgi:polysaccharide export outer membrane protein